MTSSQKKADSPVEFFRNSIQVGTKNTGRNTEKCQPHRVGGKTAVHIGEYIGQLGTIGRITLEGPDEIYPMVLEPQVDIRVKPFFRHLSATLDEGVLLKD